LVEHRDRFLASGRTLKIGASPFLARPLRPIPRGRWTIVFLAAVTSLVLAWPEPTELLMRGWGTVLHLIGIATVVVDIANTRERFGLPGWATAVREFFFGNSVVLNARLGRIGTRGFPPRLMTRAHASPDANVAQRLDAVEQNLGRLDAEVGDVWSSLTKARVDFEDGLAVEREERQRAFERVGESLRGAMTEDKSVLVFGAVWLAVGLLLATFAKEIATRSWSSP
jgi:hypothetical protein